jgi:hypothetical protein
LTANLPLATPDGYSLFNTRPPSPFGCARYTLEGTIFKGSGRVEKPWHMDYAGVLRLARTSTLERVQLPFLGWLTTTVFGGSLRNIRLKRTCLFIDQRIDGFERLEPAEISVGTPKHRNPVFNANGGNAGIVKLAAFEFSLACEFAKSVPVLGAAVQDVGLG